MHHSGCTSRQLTPFEIRCLRPTISRSPGDQGGPVRWLGYQLDTCHRPSTKRILQHVTGNPVGKFNDIDGERGERLESRMERPEAEQPELQ